MKYPTIHLNGTSPDSLLDGLVGAMTGINAAIEALAVCCPNGRDYPQGGYSDAVDDHASRFSRLESVLKELDLLALNISDQSKR